MLVALGFALALFLVMLFGRVFWGIAVNLGARRNAKHVPVQMLELQADRDRLRAEHAMMARKLELRLGDMKSRMTEQMAEVSRSRNRQQSLIQELEERETTLGLRNQEIARLNTQIDAQKADIEASANTIAHVTKESESKDLENLKLAQKVAQLSLSLREQNEKVDRLNSELQTSLGNIQSVDALPPSEARLKRRIAEITSISAQMTEQHDSNVQILKTPLTNLDLSDTPNRPSVLISKLSDTKRVSNPMAPELNELDAILDQKFANAKVEVTSNKSNARANIISLAQRIRALKSGEGV